MAGNNTCVDVLFETTFRQPRANPLEFGPWLKRCSFLFLFMCRRSELLLPTVPKRDTGLQADPWFGTGLSAGFVWMHLCVCILPYILHVTIAEVRSESCNNSCCTTTSILHPTLDLFLDCGFAIKLFFLIENVSFLWPSFVPTMRGETAIEKHLRFQKQADELSEKIDFNACVYILRTRDLAVTQAKKLLESRGWWMPAFSELPESSKQGRIQNEKDADEYSDFIVDSTLQCKSPAVKEETERFVGKDTVDTPKTKKSKLFDTPLSEIVLHRNCNCWQNTPGVHIQRALYELELVVFSSMNIRSLSKERQQVRWRLRHRDGLRGDSFHVRLGRTSPAGEHRERPLLERCALGVFGEGTRWPLPFDSTG